MINDSSNFCVGTLLKKFPIFLMSETFEMYEHEYEQACTKLLGKFHTAPSATEQDIAEARLEYAEAKKVQTNSNH
jgi:hypothetical protein